MNAEKALEKAVEKPDFLAESGSRLYGTNLPTSDYDLRGFVLPPMEYLFGVKKFECRELEGDHKVFSVHRFISLVMKGDPQCTELLFAGKPHIVTCSAIGERVLALRPYMISNAVFNRIMGYSVSEWRKAMGTKAVREKRTHTEDEVIQHVRNTFHPDRDSMDEIIRLLYKDRPVKVISSVSGLGSKRKAQVEKYGYCVKSAAHSIRLVTQLTELMKTGYITFPRPNAKLLLKIRKGEFSKEELEKIYKETRAIAEESRKVSILPDKPDRNKVWQSYTTIVADCLHYDERFNKLVIV